MALYSSICSNVMGKVKLLFDINTLKSIVTCIGIVILWLNNVSVLVAILFIVYLPYETMFTLQ